MDALTQTQRRKMYDEIADLIIRYGKDKTAKRMLKAFFNELKQVETSRELNIMKFTLASLRYLLAITFPTK